MIPVSLLLIVVSALGPHRSAEAQQPEPMRVIVHIVRAGETVDDISAQYQTPAATIMQANSLNRGDAVRTGQRILVPVAGGQLPYGTIEQTTLGLAQSLDELALVLGIPLLDLARHNGAVNPTAGVTGQAVDVPPRPQTTLGGDITAQAAPLWREAFRSNLSPYTLALDNALSDPFRTVPGQIVRVPGDQPARPLVREPWTGLTLSPPVLEQGRSTVLQATTNRPGTLTVTFLDTVWPSYSDGTTHTALIPLGRYTEPGIYPLTVVFTADDGTSSTFEQPVIVYDGRYAVERLFIPEDIAAVLSDEALVEQELAYVRGLMTTFSEEQYWEPGAYWLLPSPAVLTSAYGVTRDYNDGRLTQFHTGTDLGARAGTPIYAPVSGVVVATADLQVRGLSTILYHGRGVFTGDWHQQAILVEPNQSVTAGEQIGIMGNTGLSTAAHVHWELRILGVPVDPMQWVRQPFP
ncbi:MAG: peptidoglycan DD-metalloendopeptidase family protein [Anaerolineae bacterium]